MWHWCGSAKFLIFFLIVFVLRYVFFLPNHAWYFWSKWCQDCKCFHLLEFCGLIVVWNGRILFCGQIFWISIEYLKVVLFGPCIVYVLHIFFLCKTSVEIFVILFSFSVTVFCKVNIHKTRSLVTFCGCVAEWNVGMWDL